jgi:hypothetical protein
MSAGTDLIIHNLKNLKAVIRRMTPQVDDPVDEWLAKMDRSSIDTIGRHIIELNSRLNVRPRKWYHAIFSRKTTWA